MNGSFLKRQRLTLSGLSLLLVVFSSVTQAEEPAPPGALEILYPNGYDSGAVLRKRNADQVKAEKGFTVKVPVDYDKPKGEKIEIYAHLNQKKPFNPHFPTLIHFDGGPGQSSHLALQFFENNSVNVVRFDQRGIAFSRPKDVRMALNPDFYSSLNTARDAAAILKALKVKRATIWGVSYGTVPATLFAHHFPERTHALVLEGTVESSYGPDQVMTHSHAAEKEIEFFHRSIPAELRAKMDESVRSGKFTPEYFPRLINLHLMQFGRFRDEILYSKISNLFDPDVQMTSSSPAGKASGAKKLSSEMPELERPPFAILRLKEFTPESRIIPGDFILKDGKISSEPPRQENYAGLFSGLKPNSNLYLARDLEVSVPVVYLQGTRDPATPPLGAVKHFKAASTAPKQLFAFKNTGHGVMVTLEGIGANHAIDVMVDSILTNGWVNMGATQALKRHIDFTLIESGDASGCADYFRGI